MALSRMSQASNDAPIPPGWSSRMPARLLHGIAALLIMVLFAAALNVLLQLREDALRDARQEMDNLASVLAGQADQAIRAVDLVLDGVAREVASKTASRGATEAGAYDRLPTDAGTVAMLRERMNGVPQIDALLLLGADGRPRAATRAWPPTGAGDDDPRPLPETPPVSPPASPIMLVGSKADGGTLMIRPLSDAIGNPVGFAAAVIRVDHFAGLYRSIIREGEGVAALLRDDGASLARTPATTGPAIAQPAIAQEDLARIAGEGRGIARARDAAGTAWISSARRLPSWPLTVLVMVREDVALGDWRRMVWMLGLAAGGCALALITTAGAMGRHWRQREAFAEEQESRFVAEAALMRERERSAENESRAKSGFLAMMSHEIRTPMNGVLGLAGSLLDTTLTGRQRKMVEAVRDSGDSLLRILNDILDFSKLDAGQMQLEEAPFSPATLTQNPVSLLGPRALAKGLTLDAVCDDTLPAALLGDAGRIRQVLLNLVSNAVKFTESGSVTIHATCFARDTRSATVVWTITDTGIGIAADRLGSLFGEFIQADASINRRFGGSGLGLAISKRLVEQMGGTIAVESRPGQGSSFRIALRLPVTEPAPEEAAPSFDVDAAFAMRLRHLGRSARILFAEDNPTNQFVALQLLRGFDVQIDVVADGLEAVHAASSFLYDAICMDMRMPEMDGLAATRAIRARGGHLGTLPIIALTANAFPEDVAACFDAGMTAFIAKPVRKDILLAALLTALGHAHPADAAPGQAASDSAETGRAETGRTETELAEMGRMGAEGALDRIGFARLTLEIGAEGVAELIVMFEDETRDRLLRIGDAGLEQAVLIREVHSLKGAAGAACAELLYTRAADLELRLTRGGGIPEEVRTALTEAFEAWLREVRGLPVASALAA